MPSRREFKAQYGYLTIANNSTDVDYFKLAHLQAQSIKKYMPQAQTAVIVNEETHSAITEQNRKIFDHIIIAPEDLTPKFGRFGNEALAYRLTPFKETIKLESDLVMTRAIDHWKYGLRSRDILFPIFVTNFKNQAVLDEYYRKFFRINSLPNVYNGIYYFRYSETASRFFDLVYQIFESWNEYKMCWKMSPDEASTDVVFAIAVFLLGEDVCTNPALSYPIMTHMKGGINGLHPNADWTNHLYSQLDQDFNLIVGLTKQWYPFHYYVKHWTADYDRT